jgi:signal peptidase I
MTASASGLTTSARARPLRWRIARAVVTRAAPLGGAVAALRWLVPDRLDGGTAGPLAQLARVGDEHPLALALALFTALALVAEYWWRRWAPFADSDPLRGPRFWGALAAVLVAAALARSSIVQIDRVVSPSMVPTLGVRDRILVNRLAYGLRLPFSGRRLATREPKRGDVVVFPSDARPAEDARALDEPRALVKRVLGLPGDVVAVDQGVVSINGWRVPVCDAGPFVTTAGSVTVRGRLVVEFLGDRVYLTVREPADDSTFAPFRVPAGEVFVVGDARSVSRDSRAWNHGRGAGVPIATLEGRVSRLAIGASHDGRLDLRQLFAPLGVAVREPDVDLSATTELVAACLRRPPPETSPPASR